MESAEPNESPSVSLAELSREAFEAIRSVCALREGTDHNADSLVLCSDDVEIERDEKRYIGFQTAYRIKLLRPCHLGDETDSGRFSLRRLQRGVENSVHGTVAINAWITECKLLTSLDPHPNLIRLLCLQKDSSFGPNMPNSSEGYFFVTDYIEETLEDRLASSRRRPQETLSEKLQVAVDVASALILVHASTFVYFVRPEKIGFDASGCTKLFDFGDCQSSRLKGHRVGSSDRIETLAYTAPEVFLQGQIGCSVDSYGLGILVWEIATMRKPYGSLSRAEHFEKVVLGGKRPAIEDLPPNCGLDKLLKQCWAPKKRPAMESLHRKLIGWTKLEGTVDESNCSQRELLKRHKSESDTGTLSASLKSLDTKSAVRNGDEIGSRAPSSRRLRRVASSDASRVSRSSTSSKKSTRSELRRGTTKEKSFRSSDKSDVNKSFRSSDASKSFRSSEKSNTNKSFRSSEKSDANKCLRSFEKSDISKGVGKKDSKLEGGENHAINKKSTSVQAPRRRPSAGRIASDVDDKDTDLPVRRPRRRPSMGRLVVDTTNPKRLIRRQSTGALGSSQHDPEENKFNIKSLIQRAAKQNASENDNFSDDFDFHDPFSAERKGPSNESNRWANFEIAQSAARRPPEDGKGESDFDIVYNPRPNLTYGHSFASRYPARSKSDDTMQSRQNGLREMRLSIVNHEPNLSKEYPTDSLSQLKESLEKARESSEQKRDRRSVLGGVRRLGLSGRNLMEEKTCSPPRVKKQTRRTSIVADLSQEYASGKKHNSII